jgi:hypothetical protein
MQPNWRTVVQEYTCSIIKAKEIYTLKKEVLRRSPDANAIQANDGRAGSSVCIFILCDSGSMSFVVVLLDVDVVFFFLENSGLPPVLFET